MPRRSAGEGACRWAPLSEGACTAPPHLTLALLPHLPGFAPRGLWSFPCLRSGSPGRWPGLCAALRVGPTCVLSVLQRVQAGHGSGARPPLAGAHPWCLLDTHSLCTRLLTRTPPMPRHTPDPATTFTSGLLFRGALAGNGCRAFAIPRPCPLPTPHLHNPCLPCLACQLTQVRQRTLPRAPLPGAARPAVRRCVPRSSGLPGEGAGVACGCARRGAPFMSLSRNCELSAGAAGPSTSARRWKISASGTPATGGRQKLVVGPGPVHAGGSFPGCADAKGRPSQPLQLQPSPAALPASRRTPCRTDAALQELHRRFPWVCVW